MTSATVLAATNSGGGVGGFLLPVILVVFVGLMFLSQRRRKAAAAQSRAGLGPGAVVVTAGGLHATVQTVEDGVASLEIAPGIICQYEVVSIARVVSRPGGDPDGGPDGGFGSSRVAADDGAGDGVSLHKLPPDDQPPASGRPA